MRATHPVSSTRPAKAFPYRPHVTIAYVKKGMGGVYASMLNELWLAYVKAGLGGAYAAAMGELGIVFHADRLAFRDRDGRQTEIDLTGPPAPAWSLCGSAGPVTGRMKSFDEDKVNRDKGKFASKPGKPRGGKPDRKARRAEARGRNRAAADNARDELRHARPKLADRPLAKPIYTAVAQAYIAFLEQPTRDLAAAAIDPGPLRAVAERSQEEYVRRAVTAFSEDRAEVFDGLSADAAEALQDVLREVLAESLPPVGLDDLDRAAAGVRDGSLTREEARAGIRDALTEAWQADPGPDDLPHPEGDWVSDSLADTIARHDDAPGAGGDDPDARWDGYEAAARRIAEAFHAHLVALAPERREKGWALPPLAPVGHPPWPRA